jgi:hypothetical protein
MLTALAAGELAQGSCMIDRQELTDLRGSFFLAINVMEKA